MGKFGGCIMVYPSKPKVEIRVWFVMIRISCVMIGNGLKMIWDYLSMAASKIEHRQIPDIFVCCCCNMVFCYVKFHLYACFLQMIRTQNFPLVSNHQKPGGFKKTSCSPATPKRLDWRARLTHRSHFDSVFQTICATLVTCVGFFPLGASNMLAFLFVCFFLRLYFITNITMLHDPWV